MKRRSLVILLLPAVCVACAGVLPRTSQGAASAAEKPPKHPVPVRVGTVRQLFVDDHVIDSTNLVRRTVHPAEKYPGNPVLRADRAWEADGMKAYLYGTVLQDGGLLKMWYFSGSSQRTPREEYMLYATSEDGIHWEKPSLGIHEFDGSKQNNICMVSDAGNMEAYGPFFDPHDADPARRYKTLLWEVRDGKRGVWSATSPDGLHWTKGEQPAATGVGDTVGMLHGAPAGSYIGYVKVHTGRGRSRAWIQSRDFKTWTKPKLFLESDDQDRQPCQFYNNTGFRYQGMYLGWLQLFYLHRNDPYMYRLDLELIHSRDGRSWQRMPGRPLVLPIGPDGAWDRANNAPGGGAPVRIGDKLYLYYSGRTYLHDRGPFQDGRGAKDPELASTNIGLATLRTDGFVSLDASPVEGTVLTKPLILEDATLHLNCVSDWGVIRVELRDAETGEPIDGYCKDECLPIRANAIDHAVKWKGEQSLPEGGQPVRLNFYMKNARLYSFWTGQ